MVSSSPVKRSNLDFKNFFQSKKDKTTGNKTFAASAFSRNVRVKESFAYQLRKIADAVPQRKENVFGGSVRINDQLKEVNENLLSINSSIKDITNILVEQRRQDLKNIKEKRRKYKRLAGKMQAERKENVLEGKGKGFINALKKPFSAINRALGNPLDKIKNALLMLGIGWLTDKFIKLFQADRDGEKERFDELVGEISKGLLAMGGIALALGGGLTALIATIGGLATKVGFWIASRPFVWLYRLGKFVFNRLRNLNRTPSQPRTPRTPRTPTNPANPATPQPRVKPRNLNPTGGGPRGTSTFTLEQARKALTKQRMMATTTAKSGGLSSLFQKLFRPKVTGAGGGPKVKVVGAGNPIATAAATAVASILLGLGLDWGGNKLSQLMGTDEGSQLAKLAEKYTNADPEGRKKIEAFIDAQFKGRLESVSNPLAAFGDVAGALTGASRPTEDLDQSARQKDLILQLKQYERMTNPNVTDQDLLLFAALAASQTKPGSGERVVYPGGIGTFVRGRDPLSRKFIDKYFDPSGKIITKKEFDSRVRALRKALMDSPTGNLADAPTAPTAPAAPDPSVMMTQIDFYNAKTNQDINERRDDRLLGASTYEEYKTNFATANPSATPPVEPVETVSPVEPVETNTSAVTPSAPVASQQRSEAVNQSGFTEGQQVTVDVAQVTAAGQKQTSNNGQTASAPPALSSRDLSNPYRLLARSIYNVVVA